MSTEELSIVVGSGPAGAFCAQGLIDAGEKVVLIDIGRTLEEVKNKKIVEAQAKSFDELTSKDLQDIFGKPVYDETGAKPKLKFNSDFCYGSKKSFNLIQEKTDCNFSTALGGLSNVWGAALLPWDEKDFEDWPFGRSTLQPYYEKVLRMIPHNFTSDDVSDFHRIPRIGVEGGFLSPQGEKIYKNYRAKYSKSNVSKEFLVGASKLAINYHSDSSERCRNCMRCLEGCIYNSIFNSDQIVQQLDKNPRFSYRSGIEVKSYKETSEGVEIYVFNHNKNKSEILKAKKLFLGAGVIPTFKIVSSSIGDITSSLKYNPYFLLPAVSFQNVKNIEDYKGHNLSQLFIEMFNKKISDRQIHVQLYGYNQVMKVFLDSKMPKFLHWFGRRFLLGRMYALQGYFNSKDGAQVQISSKITNGDVKIYVSSKESQSFNDKIVQFKKYLGKKVFSLKLLPLMPMLKVGKPGIGNHIGGTFPMASSGNRGSENTDSLGRLPYHKNTYIVDASTFPSLSAATVTLTIMANAYRIGNEASKGE